VLSRRTARIISLRSIAVNEDFQWVLQSVSKSRSPNPTIAVEAQHGIANVNPFGGRAHFALAYCLWNTAICRRLPPTDAVHLATLWFRNRDSGKNMAPDQTLGMQATAQIMPVLGKIMLPSAGKIMVRGTNRIQEISCSSSRAADTAFLPSALNGINS
jgi:hypothetical protein